MIYRLSIVKSITITIVSFILPFIVYGKIQCLPKYDNVKNPWFVRIYVNNNYSCGGVLISNRHVITSRQCFRDFTGKFREVPKSQVVLGLGSDSRDMRYGLLFHPQSIEVYLDHSCYEKTKKFDWCRDSIAIVELREVLDLDCNQPNIKVARVVDVSSENFDWRALHYDKCIAPGFNDGGTIKPCEVAPESIKSSLNSLFIKDWLNSNYSCKLSHTDTGVPLLCRNNKSGDGKWEVEGLFNGYNTVPIKTFNKVGRFIGWFTDRIEKNDHKVYHEIACYNETLKLFCDNERKPTLRIETAFYGRRALRECQRLNSGEHMSSTHCKRDVKAYLTQTCDGQPKCSVRVSSDVWGDPCPRVNKYLWVSYRCGDRHESKIQHGSDSSGVRGAGNAYVSLVRLLVGAVIACAAACV